MIMFGLGTPFKVVERKRDRVPARSGGESEQVVIQRLEAMLQRMVQPLLDGLQKKMERPAQEWFSIAEVAALTGLSDDHVRRHVKAGLLPASNQGTFDKPTYRIHRRDIDQ